MNASSSHRADADTVKACCAMAYSGDRARALLGDSFHPGGTRLTDRVADLLDIGDTSRVLDVAAGVGTSAIHLASLRGCHIVGVDLSADNVAEAARRAHAAGVGDRVVFHRGDAEILEVRARSFDAVLCECAFCTFPDKRSAAEAMARALRPRGRVGISDITRRGGLPAELDGLLAWVACIADALPVEGYADALAGAGLSVEHVEVCDGALLEMAEGIAGRLLGARLLIETGRLSLPGVDLDAARSLARSAIAAVRDGRLGYAVLCATKPADSQH